MVRMKERPGFESCLQNQSDCSWAVFSMNKQGNGVGVGGGGGQKAKFRTLGNVHIGGSGEDKEQEKGGGGGQTGRGDRAGIAEDKPVNRGGSPELEAAEGSG